MSETPNQAKPVTDTLDDLLNNPFSTPVDTLTTTQQAEISQLKEQQTAPRLIDKLPPERQAQAQELASKIDATDQQAVITYGAAAQTKLGEFSQSMLNHVQAADIGPVGDSLTELMYRLQEANPDELRAGEGNLFKRMFGKVKQSIFEITAKYQKIGAQIDKIAVKLDKEKDGLLKDNLMLEQLYQKNKDYFDALNIYIAAGELKMQELQTKIIPEAMKKAEETNDQMDVQIANDYTQFLDRLDKRTHDLRLARQITIQQAPQIRLIQNTNQALAEKIQASVNTAIGAILGTFATGPAVRNLVSNTITEVIGTFVLVFGLLAFGANTFTDGLNPIVVGILILAIGLSLGGPTGYAINPARDLGPRIAHQILPIKNKGTSDWGYALVPIIGPMIGAAIAAGLFMMLPL